MTRKSQFKKEHLITIALVLSFLALWEVSVRTGNLSALVFPAPTVILKTFAVDLVHGVYTKDTLISLSRMFVGIVIGGGSGLILGLIMGWSKPVRATLDPIISALLPIPKLTLLPMAIIIFGLGEGSRTAMVSISAFFPMLINTMVGVAQINPTYYEVVENYGASWFDTFRRVVLPGSMPFVLSGFRLSFQGALMITVGVEMVWGNNGLGSVLWLAWETMRMTSMYSVLIIISIIGVGFNALLEYAQKLLLPWHHENRAS
jgi:NitT/TauT family transport system permease protein